MSQLKFLISAISAALLVLGFAYSKGRQVGRKAGDEAALSKVKRQQKTVKRKQEAQAREQSNTIINHRRNRSDLVDRLRGGNRPF